MREEKKRRGEGAKQPAGGRLFTATPLLWNHTEESLVFISTTPQSRRRVRSFLLGKCARQLFMAAALMKQLLCCLAAGCSLGGSVYVGGHFQCSRPQRQQRRHSYPPPPAPSLLSIRIITVRQRQKPLCISPFTSLLFHPARYSDSSPPLTPFFLFSLGHPSGTSFEFAPRSHVPLRFQSRGLCAPPKSRMEM